MFMLTVPIIDEQNNLHCTTVSTRNIEEIKRNSRNVLYLVEFLAA